MLTDAAHTAKQLHQRVSNMNTKGHYKDLGFDLSLAGVSHGEFAFKAFVNPITAAPSSDQTAKLDQFSIPF